MPRLLLIKLGAIGDVIMAIPAAFAMHAGGYEIDWVCGTAVAPILGLYPWINVILLDEGAMLRGGIVARMVETLRLWRVLALRHYDVCATLYYDPRLRLLTLPVRSGVRISLSDSDRSRHLLPGRHHTDEFARILTRQSDGERSSHLVPIEISASNPALAPNPLNVRSESPRIVLFPAGARNALRDDALRRWPVASYVVLAEVLLSLGYEVVVSGGPDDRWACSYFVDLNVTNCIGMFSISETLAIISSADVIVTHDTGPLHIAGLTATSIVSIFGPTDPHGRLPQRSNAVAIWGGTGFSCRPCYDGRDFPDCAHNGCMHQVSPAMVLRQIDILLSARREGLSIPPRVVAAETEAFVKVSSLIARHGVRLP